MLKYIRSFFRLFKKAVTLFNHFNGLKLSASLSFYTVFSIGPFLIILISLAGVFFGKQAVEGKVYGEISGLIGSATAIQVQDIIGNIQKSNHGTIGSIIGLIVLVIGASAVFSELQDSITHIWSTRPKPTKGWSALVIRKLLSFSLLLGMAFILMVSLFINALTDILSEALKSRFPESIVKSFFLVNNILILFVVGVLFTLIFKILPNTRILWKDAILGALFTAVLFIIGKFIIGFYLGNSKIGITYGAAASIVILMLWVYYSAIILYFGACFTRAYTASKSKLAQKSV
jgi:membrane protein